MGNKARVFNTTMGSARDLQSAGLRRLIINASYWVMGLEEKITPNRSVAYISKYEPRPSGFNYEKIGVRPQLPSEFR
jgi:hypothetical protein